MDSDLIQKTIADVADKLNRQLEDLLIDGLGLKGFSFSNSVQMVDFIKKNVICKKNVDLKENIYYVCDVPFLLHKYEPTFNTYYFERNISLKADFGSYKYL